MTPKEKAKELVNKYLDTLIHFPYIDTEDSICIGAGYMVNACAKQCALVAVDEILKAVDNPDETYLMKNSVDYWQDVKNEIEKL